MTPTAAVGAAHPDWPQDPSSGAAMLPGTGPGAYTYAPGAAGAFTLTVHLHSGDFQAGGTAPSPAAPARGSGPRSPDHHRRHPVTRRVIAVVLATAVLALLLAAAAPRAEAVSFVDKQVQAGALLIQNYINTYGQAHQFIYPPKSMVKKGGGLPNATVIWPSNPWTGKVMGPGTSRGTYTYAPAADGHSYRLTVHLSSGNYLLRSAMPVVAQDRAQHRLPAEPAAPAAVPVRVQDRQRRLPGDGLAHPGQLPESDLRVAEEPVDRHSHGGERRPRRLLLHPRQRDRLHAEGQADHADGAKPSARPRCWAASR